jgi:hypothetical protein
LLKNLRSYQVNAFYIGSEKNDWQIEIPNVPSIGLPLMEHHSDSIIDYTKHGHTLRFLLATAHRVISPQRKMRF